MIMQEMNKYQLIEAMIHDLGDQNDGIQVRGYRNANIIKGCVEALARLREILRKEDEDKAGPAEITLKEQTGE